MTPAPVVSKAMPEPPPIPQELLKPSAPKIARPTKPPIDWEQFMGAKLFAWIGGLALFLGIAFFVKYSFEHNLIPPELRIAIGFVVGAGLVVGGLLLKRKENAVTAQTLCATGILVLYAVTFACRAYYHFAFFGLIPTFLLMTLITAVAFLLSVRLNAIIVAVLGIAGGFLTPILLSTNQDNPLGLFGYIALLDIGLLALAQRQRWNALPILGAIGTALMQFAWVDAYFVPEKYFAGNKVLIFMAVFVGFQALFLAATAWAKRTGKENTTLFVSAIGLAAVAMFSAFYLLGFPPVAHRPALLFTYLFVIDLGLLALTLIGRKLAIVRILAGLAAFIFLGAWTGNYLTIGHIYTALGFYFVFALFHAAVPIALQRLHKIEVPRWTHIFPALALLLVLIPIFRLTELSLLVWPFVLIIDVLAIGLAIATATLLPVIAVLVLTLVAVGAWLLRIPTELTGLPMALLILACFAIFFFVAVKLGVPPFDSAGNTRAKPVRQHHRPGKSLGSTSRALRDVAVSAAHHGGAAVTAGKSVACIWSGIVAGDFASRHERNLFARSAPGGRARLRARAGARVAFRTFRCDARNAAADLVSRILCPVHDLSVRFP